MGRSGNSSSHSNNSNSSSSKRKRKVCNSSSVSVSSPSTDTNNKSSSSNSNNNHNRKKKKTTTTTTTTTTRTTTSLNKQQVVLSSDRRSNMWSSSGKKKRSSHHSSSGGGGSSSSSSNLGTSTINEKEAEKVFAKIADEDDPMIATMEGICVLCEELEIDPYEDTTILVLMWKMGANSKPAQISKEEWMKGCRRLQVDKIDKFVEKLPSWDTGFLDQSEFKEFYKFCFQFNREGTYKTLDKTLVVQLLKLVLSSRISKTRLESFCQFVSDQTSYTRITLDQWTSFLDFCYECDEDLSNYDEDSSAWPVLIDDYVKFVQDNKH